MYDIGHYEYECDCNDWVGYEIKNKELRKLDEEFYLSYCKYQNDRIAIEQKYMGYSDNSWHELIENCIEK